MEVSIQKRLEDSLHWIIFNIPGTAHELAEGIPRIATLPDGTVQPMNPRGHYGYRGPGAVMPPRHHYTFELYALDTTLALNTEATRAEVLRAVEGHILGKAILMGLYHRR
jgi:Raf kinase inhibitor-like YbhB/YbcL family protein